jgi:hypothetical protein
VRPLALACLLLLSGCVSPELAVQTSPPASASPSAPSPLPSGVIDPQPLIDRATHLTSIVLRVDRVTAKLTTLSDFMEGSGVVRAGASPGQRIWVVAIRGDIRIDAIIDVPHGQCALFASDAAGGDILAARSGPASICDPYFN